MNFKFLRVYKRMDIEEVKSHLVIFGDLTASCGKCNEMGFKFESLICPACKTEFKYMAFRNVKENMPKVQKFSETYPDLICIDFDDFKKIEGVRKAKELFG